MAQLVFDNSIGWAHFHLRGGWTRLWWFVGMFCLVSMAFVLAPVSLVRTVAPGLQGYLVNGFLGFECALCMLVIPAVSGGAVRLDLKEKMIESHRLMPVSGSEAIVGYLFAANAISLALMAASTLIGAIAAESCGMDAGRFFIASLIIFLFGALLAIISVYGAFGGKNAGGLWIVIAFAPIIATATDLGQYLPGSAVFNAPFMRKTVFSMQAGSDEPLAYLISEVFGLLTGSLFFIGAARRYRSAAEPGFTPWMSMGLVAIWIAASAVGMRRWNLFHWQTFASAPPDKHVQWAVASAVAMFFSATPVIQSRGIEELHAIRHRLNPDFAGPKPVSPSVVIAICTALIVSLGPLAIPTLIPAAQLLLTALISASFLFSMRCAHHVRVRRLHLRIATIYLYATWAGPPLLVHALQWLNIRPLTPAGLLADPICACSPPIALYELSIGSFNPFGLGMLFQISCALVLGAIASMTSSRRRQPTARVR